MGLLGSLSDDDKALGLLNLGAGMIAGNRGTSSGAAFQNAIGAGMGNYTNTLAMLGRQNLAREELDQRGQWRKLQEDQMRQQMEMREASMRAQQQVGQILGSDMPYEQKLSILAQIPGGIEMAKSYREALPKRGYQDLGGQLAPTVDGQIVQGQAVPKTSAPSSIPFEATGLTPEQYRGFKLQNSAAGATNIGLNVSTEKKYGEMFAGKIADADIAMRDAASKAPALAERANAIKEVLASGRVITGAGADIRLQLGKVLNLAGATDAETIANTEVLATSLAQNTLDAIKASGLGGGTGFSNADRDFLEKAVGGKITLEAATLNRLADLSYRAAEQSAKKWTSRAKMIPKSAVEGTGLDISPIEVPKPYGTRSMSPPSAQDLVDEARRRGLIK